MEYGARGETIEEVVAILEGHLGIAMREGSNGEIGVSFYWGSDFGAKNGVQYYGINVLPTRYAEPNDDGSYLARDEWEPYTFVVEVSDELAAENAKIRALIAKGVLAAQEIPTPPVATD